MLCYAMFYIELYFVIAYREHEWIIRNRKRKKIIHKVNNKQINVVSTMFKMYGDRKFAVLIEVQYFSAFLLRSALI